jgi:hypothetical protein
MFFEAPFSETNALAHSDRKDAGRSRPDPLDPAATWQEDRITDAPDAHWETAPERYEHRTERYGVGALPRTLRLALAPGGGAFVVWRRGE